MKVELTKDEIVLIIHALTIASEDGSIFPTTDEDKQEASDNKVNAAIDVLINKLKKTK